MCLTALIVIGIIALIIFLIMMIPVGADIGYADGQLSLSAKVMGIFLQLLPKEEVVEKKPKKGKKPKKEKKPKKPKKEETPAEEPEKEEEGKKKKGLPLGLTIDDLLDLVKAVFKGLGKFRIWVDRFLLHYIAAGKDPYKTAVTFGKINATLCALAPMCRKKFKCRDTDVYTDINFAEEKPFIEFGLGFHIRIGTLFAVANAIIFRALWIIIRSKTRQLFDKIRGKLERKPEEALAETE